jgi:4-amino-4-deoxy-L-arabinose transferase-like glycosyltransferase
LLLKKHLLPNSEDNKKVTFILITYLFGTVNFAMISQSLWQHGAVQLFTLLGIYALLNGIKGKSTSQLALAGLCLSLAVLSRPTAALFAVLLSLLILLANRESLKQSLKAGLYLGLGVVPALIFFLWYKMIFQRQNQGYAGQLFSSWFSPFLRVL